MMQETPIVQDLAEPAGQVPFRRKVFYIPGYDPFPPRRYRELYRFEGAAQAQTSGYGLLLKPKAMKGAYGWRVFGQIGGRATEAEVEVLVWTDLVRSSMDQGIAATYLQLVRTAWAYLGSGALIRLAGLRKGPTIAALYPVAALLAQLAVALALAAGVGAVLGLLHPGLAWAAALPVIWGVLWLGRRWDHRLFAYYLMHDYAYSAQNGGANPPELEARMADFAGRIRAALDQPLDEVLVVGHSSGAHLGVSILADLLRKGLPADAPALGFLSLGHVVPMVSFLPRAQRLRGDLAYLSASDALTCALRSGGGDGRFPAGQTLAAGGVGRLHPDVEPRALESPALAVLSLAFSIPLRL
jgi:hypothetical protein